MNSVLNRLKAQTVGGASPVDLLALGLSRRQEDISEEVARGVLKHIGRIETLASISSQEIHDMTGLDPYEVLRVQALIELGRRAGIAGKGDIRTIEDPADVFELFDYLRNERKEHFCVVLLDTKNHVMKTSTIHIGTLDMSLVGAREIFREAIREGAASIIAVHNHPSGDPTPSAEDVLVTERLADVGRMLEIPLLDHVIVGFREFVSLSQRGVLNPK